jgi:hypothetical protein
MASGLNLMTYFVTGMQPKSEWTVDTILSFPLVQQILFLFPAT